MTMVRVAAPSLVSLSLRFVCSCVCVFRAKQQERARRSKVRRRLEVVEGWADDGGEMRPLPALLPSSS